MAGCMTAWHPCSPWVTLLPVNSTVSASAACATVALWRFSSYNDTCSCNYLCTQKSKCVKSTAQRAQHCTARHSTSVWLTCKHLRLCISCWESWQEVMAWGYSCQQDGHQQRLLFRLTTSGATLLAMLVQNRLQYCDRASTW